jgi:hypothetical protein
LRIEVGEELSVDPDGPPGHVDVGFASDAAMRASAFCRARSMISVGTLAGSVTLPCDP